MSCKQAWYDLYKTEPLANQQSRQKQTNTNSSGSMGGIPVNHSYQSPEAAHAAQVESHFWSC